MTGKISLILLLLLGAIQVPFSVRACNIPAFKMAALYWPQEMYKLLYFYDVDSKPCKETDAMLKEIEGEWVDKVNIKLVKVDVNDQGAKGVVGEYKVKEVPLLLIVSPRGDVLARFQGGAKASQLREVISSPMKSEIIKALDQCPVLCLHIQSRRSKGAENISKLIASVMKVGEEMFANKIKILEVDPLDRQERYLLENLGLAPGGKEPAIVMVVGRGKATEPLVGKNITEEQLMDQLQMLNWMCGCTANPAGLGQDLLLPKVWEDGDLPMFWEGVVR